MVCGIDRAFEVIQRLDPTAAIEAEIADGGRVQTAPAAAATIEASLRALLTGERTALNLLQRMSGIATASRAATPTPSPAPAPSCSTPARPRPACARSTSTRCLRRRRQPPGRAARRRADQGQPPAVGRVGRRRDARRARRIAPALAVEVEVDTLDQLRRGARRGRRDDPARQHGHRPLRAGRGRAAGRARLEASGGITLETIRAIAETGVDAISVGALTHSVRALDIALEVIPSSS